MEEKQFLILGREIKKPFAPCAKVVTEVFRQHRNEPSLYNITQKEPGLQNIHSFSKKT